MTDIKLSIFGDIDLAGWPEAVTKLIETVDKHVGLWSEAGQKEADAKKYADIKEAETVIEIQKMAMRAEIDQAFAERAIRRLTEDNLRHQRNREAIVTIAAEELKQLPAEAVSDQPVDEDWLAQFFEYVQNISNEQMQSLWGRLLAGEVAKPGFFSPRTLQLVRVLKQSDAEVFTSFCSQVWVGSKGKSFRLAPYWKDMFVEIVDADYSLLSHLDTLGLVSYNEIQVRLEANIDYTFSYCGISYLISSPDNEPRTFLVYNLTDTGNELVPLSGAKPDEVHLAKALEVFELRNFLVRKIE